MTSPLAVIGLTYAGVDVQLVDLQRFLEIVHGLNETPAVRGVDTIVPGLAGRIEGTRVNDVITIVLEGLVRADPALTSRAAIIASFRANVAVVRALFASNRARAALVATLEDGSLVTIMARPMPGIMWSEPEQSESVHVSIELEGYGDWVAV